MELMDLHGAHIPAMLKLNNAHALQTSELDAAGLSALLNLACYARGNDCGAGALLIAFDHRADYDNPNFNWFKARYDAFIYVDRIIVSETHRGKGLAKKLYQDLFAYACRAGTQYVLCEVNSEPPNAAPDSFHAALGFNKVGHAALAQGKKTVNYMEKRL